MVVFDLSILISLHTNQFDTMKGYTGFLITLLAAGAVADLPYQIDNEGVFLNSVPAFRKHILTPR